MCLTRYGPQLASRPTCSQWAASSHGRAPADQSLGKASDGVRRPLLGNTGHSAPAPSEMLVVAAQNGEASVAALPAQALK
jgi:hypothetical protein